MLALITSSLLILSARSLAADGIFMTDLLCRANSPLEAQSWLIFYFISDLRITFGHSLLECSGVNKLNVISVKTMGQIPLLQRQPHGIQ